MKDLKRSYTLVISWFVLTLVASFFIFLLPDAWAVSNCGLGLTSGGPVEIDGQATGVEWNDATVMNSTDPCFGFLDDLIVAGSDTLIGRNVTIRSKRYQRGATWYYGFLVAVEDVTTSGPPECAGKVCQGEKVILQFNPTINGDDELRSDDRQFVLEHHWVNAGDGTIEGALSLYGLVVDAFCPQSKWNQGSPLSTAGSAFAITNAGGGYVAEIEIPLSLVGSPAPASDIGVALAVLNDFGMTPLNLDFDCSAAGVCSGAGVGFPSGMDITNIENPVDAPCLTGWVTPFDWGVGYHDTPPGDVWIKRTPRFYTSESIEVLECGNPGYQYYRDNPCKIRIRATVDKTGAAASRDILFLWADHGTSDPNEYKFVDLKRVTIVGASATATSLDFSVPSGLAHHPCLRVYILPTDRDPAFDVTQAVQTKAFVESWEVANHVETQHWAQKNIHIHDTTTVCPDPDCRVGALQPPKQPASLVARAYAAKSAMPAGILMTGQMATHAMTHPMRSPVGLSPAEWKRYSPRHMIVEVSAYGYSPSAQKPRYNFVEHLGGVVQIVPDQMVQKNRKTPFEFKVFNNAEVPMTIILQTNVHRPESIKNAVVELGTRKLTLAPGTTRTVEAGVLNRPDNSDGICRRVSLPTSLGLVTGMLILGFFGLRMNRKKRS